MAQPAIAAPRGTWQEARSPSPARRSLVLAATVVAAIVSLSVLWILITGMRPSYDAFGWLTWGRQVLHWNLNTDGAPSWKPLTFLFTLPYALAGANPQMWLWMITATGSALAGAVIAGRIAYRLSGPCPHRPWAPIAAGVLAGLGVLGMSGYSQLVLIANSDPMIITLCLAAIDSHLSGRHRLAFGLLILASFGRPEAWVFAFLYALWAWRTVPSMRLLATLGIVLIPVAWFTVPALTSHSWLTPGDLALNSQNVIHGNKALGVFNRLRNLYELPIQLAVAAALVMAILRRSKAWLGLAAVALLWVLIEIAFAYHGWSAVPRYLMEPGAVLIVLAGSAVGIVLGYQPRRLSRSKWGALAAGVVLVVALIAGSVPSARTRVRVTHDEIRAARHSGRELTRLQQVIARDGGAARIKGCGQPVTLVGKQSEVAWAVGLNVGNVGYRPGKSIQQGTPIVVLKPHDGGWEVRPYHTSPGCRELRTDSQMG
jgi:hypothetical protein